MSVGSRPCPTLERRKMSTKILIDCLGMVNLGQSSVISRVFHEGTQTGFQAQILLNLSKINVQIDNLYSPRRESSMPVMHKAKNHLRKSHWNMLMSRNPGDFEGSGSCVSDNYLQLTMIREGRSTQTKILKLQVVFVECDPPPPPPPPAWHAIPSLCVPHLMPGMTVICLLHYLAVDLPEKGMWCYIVRMLPLSDSGTLVRALCAGMHTATCCHFIRYTL